MAPPTAASGATHSPPACSPATLQGAFGPAHRPLCGMHCHVLSYLMRKGRLMGMRHAGAALHCRLRLLSLPAPLPHLEHPINTKLHFDHKVL